MGRKKRSVRGNSKHKYNVDFDRLLSDHEHGQLRTRCDYSVIRPAYAYTSQCMNERWKEGVTPGYYTARIKGNDNKNRHLNSDTWHLILDKSWS